jgi:insulysin
MILPKTENREIKHDILSNGIKSIFVQDKETDKTTVTVSVKTGSYSDPRNSQGLAHFLEHMLFIGSKKYPEEDFYETNLKKFGGSSNAYTDSFETVYYFSVFNNGVEKVMDIFSRFFIDPLFKEDAVNREINAVNSEHMKNINNDGWRIFQTIRNLSIKTNNFNTFATGSKETMDEKLIRNNMIDFYKKNYVSENISISIVSNLDIETQKKMLHKTFGNIEKKNNETVIIKKPIFDNFNKTYQVIPVSDIQQLIYIFETGNDKKYLQNKLFDILNQILISGYKDSLLNHLKLLGYIEGLYVNIDETVGLFSIYFNLTKIGLTKLNEIDGYLKFAMNQIFNYFKSHMKNINDYYKKIFQLNFNYKEKIDPDSLGIYLVNNSHKYPIDEIYSGPFLIKKIENNVDEKFYSYFNKSVKLLVSENKIFSKDVKDKNYGTIYGEIKNIENDEIPFNFILNLDNPFLDMIPKLINVDNMIELPINIKDRVWFSSINNFNEPIIKGTLIFNNAKLFNNEKNYLLTSLAMNCLSFYLNQELFNLFSLEFIIDTSTKSTYNSLILSYSCPNDPFKFNQFIYLTIKLITNPIIPKIILESKIKSMKEDLLNIKKENPWAYADYYFKQITLSNEYNLENLLKVLDQIETENSIDSIKNHIMQMFLESSLSILFVGNMTRDQVPNNNILSKLLFHQQDSFPIVTFPKNISIKHPNIKEKSNCVKIVYYIGNFEPLRWVHTFLTYLILESPFFDELRTKKQLGYLVKCMMSNTGNNYYLVQKVQSDKSCEIIKKEINSFNLKIIDIIKKANLDEWKLSAKNYIEEKDNNTGDVFNRYFSEIISRQYLFTRKKILIQHLEKITMESLINFVDSFMINNNKVCILDVIGN